MQFNYWILIAYINKQLSVCDSLGTADLKLVEFACGPSGGQWRAHVGVSDIMMLWDNKVMLRSFIFYKVHNWFHLS